MQARDLPPEIERVFCASPVAFWKEARRSKGGGHETAHLDCVWSKCIGFVDYTAKKWVGLSIHGFYDADWACPSDEAPGNWQVFVGFVKSWQGRDKLFGVYR